jgi:hypothetical protein
VIGRDEFLNTLEMHYRQQETEQKRGLITVMNHKSILDDPCVLSIMLPIRYTLHPEKIRFSEINELVDQRH